MVSSIPMLYQSFLNRSIWPLDRTLTGTPTPNLSGPGSNDNEEVTPRAPKLELEFSAKLRYHQLED